MPVEFSLIRRYFDWPPRREETRLAVGDDAAIIAIPETDELVVCCDTLVAGRHFDEAIEPADLGWKALAVNLSDLAAMGAQPLGFCLALTLPEAVPGWLEAFSSGLRELADSAGVDLVGGDTTQGPLCITVTAYGRLPRGTALRRQTAAAGDLLLLSGTLGDAALALRLGLAAPEELRQRLDRPQPRLQDAALLRSHASAAIDVSDGLGADLAHMLGSTRGATLDYTALPRSAALQLAAPAPEMLETCLLAGGDDYELLVAMPADRWPGFREQAREPWTPIGRVEAHPGLRLREEGGTVRTIAPAGFEHF